MNDSRGTGSVVILTALDPEYQAVRDRLGGIRRHRPVTGTRFEVGTLDRGGEVVLALVGVGNHASAVLAERAIAEFSPVAVLFAGVAGALRPRLALGDVVVATQVYAYHGAAARIDGLRSRPRAWELDHGIDQAARHIARNGAWTGDLPTGPGGPRVHFGAIASGEVLHDAPVSQPLAWIREHYDDAVAIEMEGAGMAKAGHLNTVPVAVIRAISDMADGSKAGTDGRKWQPRAARNAAAFATALAAELIGPGKVSARGEQAMAGVTNNAYGNARVGVQAGEITGGVRIRPDRTPDAHDDLAQRIAQLGAGLRRAYAEGRLDKAVHEAAGAELAAVAAGRDRLAVRRLLGLVDEVPDLVRQVRLIGGLL